MDLDLGVAVRHSLLPERSLRMHHRLVHPLFFGRGYFHPCRSYRKHHDVRGRQDLNVNTSHFSLFSPQYARLRELRLAPACLRVNVRCCYDCVYVLLIVRGTDECSRVRKSFYTSWQRHSNVFHQRKKTAAWARKLMRNRVQTFEIAGFVRVTAHERS